MLESEIRVGRQQDPRSLVNNPKGLVSNREGGEKEEGSELEKGWTMYKEALRRGSKRLAYRTPSPLEDGGTDPTPPEEPEERTWQWVKRRRVSGHLGEGWEKFTPDRSTDPKIKKPQSPPVSRKT